MKRSKLFFSACLAVLIIISVTNIAAAATWGVSNGDDLKYEATYHFDNQYITGQTTTMTVTFNVTYVGDYVTADMSEDGGAAVSVFLNSQSLDPDFGLNIVTTNGVDLRYIADEQRVQAQMTQITNALGDLANFSMSRAGNSLYISAHGSGTETSWTYDAEIHYTDDYVLSSMSEDHITTGGIEDAVQNVLWTQVYHHSAGTNPATTPGNTLAPELTTPIIVGVSAAVVVGVVVIIIRRR
jgi:hypothetical protein